MATELEKRAKQEVSNTSAELLDNNGTVYSPDADIYINDDSLVLYLEVPGVKKGNVSVKLDENNVLSVKAKNVFAENGKIELKQFEIGDYYRSFQMSDEYNKDKITAQIENGLLRIEIAKKEEAKPRRIEINV